MLNSFRRIFRGLAYRGYLNWMSDELYLKYLFFSNMNRKLNFKDLKTYNEKLQWLKIYDHHKKYIDMVDKYEAKVLAEKVIGNEYIIPTLGVWDKFEEIDFNSLPNKFVLKCTHDSGGLVICRDKNNFDIESAKKKINNSLRKNFYYIGREWPYKNVKPRIIAEEFIGYDQQAPDDFKFFVFNGKIDSIMVCRDRELGKPKFLFYDLEWNRLLYQNNEPPSFYNLKKPKHFEKMIEIVENLSKDFHQIRIDLYNVDGKIYFGEYTFFNDSGFDRDISYETDLYWGSKINLLKWSK